MENYAATLSWMFDQLPMFQRKGTTAYRPGLKRMFALSNYLGNPEKRLQCIHVAGTNGKGSTSHIMASVLQESGLKVGVYTSPHLLDFRERIKINGVEISKAEVVAFISTHKVYFEQNQMSFFEMTVGMAFSYFAEKTVDVAIIEVGLGGRLDATNIIKPILAVITNIGLDHTQFLGTTLEAIAAEKAGVIKQNTPVVIGEKQDKTTLVFKQKAHEMNAPLVFASKEPPCDYSSDLRGIYQQKNIQTAVVALRQLKQFPLTQIHYKAGLKKVVANTKLRGRWELLRKKPQVIVDVSHNFEGFQYISKQLTMTPYKNLYVVMGFVKGRDLLPIFELLPSTATYHLATPNLERGLELDALKASLHPIDYSFFYHNSIPEAYSTALKNAQADDLILVCGSTFVVSEILSYI